MKRITHKTTLIALILCLVTFPSPAVSSTTFEVFSADELDELLAPIALYPDPLLAQLLPAATFVDQIAEAQKTLNGKADDNLIANQNWDISVKSIAHYPPVLQTMSQKTDWTTALGQAYVTQAADVEKSIQRLRAQAKAAGTLVTNDKTLVETKTEGGQQVIVVEPAQPEVIYVPQYDPQVVYVQQGPSTGAVVAASMISFGVGMAMGAWLNRGWNWYRGGVYYHGWAGVGWIGRSASHVNINVNRNVYVNNSYRNINVDRNVTNRNISTYRTDLQRDATTRRTNASSRDVKPANTRGDAARTADTKRVDNTRSGAATGTNRQTNAASTNRQSNATTRQQSAQPKAKATTGGGGTKKAASGGRSKRP